MSKKKSKKPPSTSASQQAPPKKEKIKIFMTSNSWLKMQYLIHVCDTEVGWHFLITRHDENFLIYDLLLFPQQVTGGTVTAEEIPYAQWLDNQWAKGTLPDLRGHGHSHVNFSCHPSEVDIKLQKGLMSQLGPNDFYFFLIKNKRNGLWMHLIDKERNQSILTDDLELLPIDAADWDMELALNLKKEVKNESEQKPGLLRSDED